MVGTHTGIGGAGGVIQLPVLSYIPYQGTDRLATANQSIRGVHAYSPPGFVRGPLRGTTMVAQNSHEIRCDQGSLFLQKQVPGAGFPLCSLGTPGYYPVGIAFSEVKIGLASAISFLDGVLD